MSEYDKIYYCKNADIKKEKWNKWARTVKGQFITSRNKAKYNDYKWTITLEEYSELRKKDCFYCGGKLPDSSRGLNRIDNTKGYTIINVVPCCTGCNTLKSNIRTKEETLLLVELSKTIRNKVNIWK